MDMENRGFGMVGGKKGGERDSEFKVSKENWIVDVIDRYRIVWKGVLDESGM